MTTTNSALDTLIEAAILAPSGDNTLPWRFTIHRSSRAIDLDVDPARDPSPMNAGQRMARISLGAALENMVRTAQRNGWEYRIDEKPSQGVVRFSLETDAGAGTIDPLLSSRVTNRRVYDGRPLPPDCLERLQRASSDAPPSTRIVLITDRELLSQLVRLIGRADALMLGTRAIRNAFLAKVRFDAPPNEEVEEGLSLGSLEVSGMDRVSLRLLRSFPPPDRLMRVLGARRTFRRVATKLASSASGFCLITSMNAGEQADIRVGRAWQDIWLRLTEEKLATQPMMSLLVLQNILDHAEQAIFSKADAAAARKLLDEFYAICGTVADGRPATLMRFGFSGRPSSRVGRLPFGALTREGQ